MSSENGRRSKPKEEREELLRGSRREFREKTRDKQR